MMIETFNLEDKLRRFKAGEDIPIDTCTEDEILAIFRSVFGSHILGWKTKTKAEVRREHLLELKRLTMSQPADNKCKLFAFNN